MRKEKVGNIDIIIDPEPDMIFVDSSISPYKVSCRVHNETSGNLKSFIKEPGRARKIYNKLRRCLCVQK